MVGEEIGESALVLNNRPQVNFKEVPGTVEKLNSESVARPLVISEEGDITGLVSGTRSGILDKSDHVLKLKGCNVEHAFWWQGPYRMARTFGVPEGGHTLSSVRHEQEVLYEVNELMRSEGFPIAQEPDAIIIYDKEFQRRLGQQIKDIIFAPATYLFGHVPKLIGKDMLAASVTRIKGDTRLPELHQRGVRVENAELVASVMYRIGLSIGTQRRVMEQEYLWGYFNCHDGNIILFEEDGKVNASMTDFNSACRVTPIGRLMHKQEREKLLAEVEVIDGYKVQGYRRSGPTLVGQMFSEAFQKGFAVGYKNPDSRESISSHELREAYFIDEPPPGMRFGLSAKRRETGLDRLVAALSG